MDLGRLAVLRRANRPTWDDDLFVGRLGQSFSLHNLRYEKKYNGPRGNWTPDLLSSLDETMQVRRLYLILDSYRWTTGPNLSYRVSFYILAVTKTKKVEMIVIRRLVAGRWLSLVNCFKPTSTRLIIVGSGVQISPGPFITLNSLDVVLSYIRFRIFY